MPEHAEHISKHTNDIYMPVRILLQGGELNDFRAGFSQSCDIAVVLLLHEIEIWHA